MVVDSNKTKHLKSEFLPSSLNLSFFVHQLGNNIIYYSVLPWRWTIRVPCKCIFVSVPCTAKIFFQISGGKFRHLDICLRTKSVLSYLWSSRVREHAVIVMSARLHQIAMTWWFLAYSIIVTMNHHQLCVTASGA